MKYSSILFGLIVIAGISGCSYWRDATFDPAFQGGYKHGDVLVTQRELPIQKGGERPGYFMGNNPKIVEYYKEGKLHESDKKDIVGLYPKGSRLELVKIWFYYNFDHGWPYIPVAKIMDGPYAGKEVSLEYLSDNLNEKGKRYKRWYLKRYEFMLMDCDTNFIKKVE